MELIRFPFPLFCDLFSSFSYSEEKGLSLSLHVLHHDHHRPEDRIEESVKEKRRKIYCQALKWICMRIERDAEGQSEGQDSHWYFQDK